MLTDEQRQDAADALLTQPSATWPDVPLEDAHYVQRRWADARLAQGPRIVARKIDLISRAMRHAADVEDGLNEATAGASRLRRLQWSETVSWRRLRLMPRLP